MRDYMNEAPAPIDQNTQFYRNRRAGPNYQTPFSIGNMAQCPGVVTEIDGEEPFDFWLFLIDEVKSFENEYTKDRSQFLAEDFVKHDIHGEILVDTYLVPEGELLRKYRYQKKLCKESWPGQAEILYGEDLTFFEQLGEFESFDTSGFEFRQEWRSYFSDTLQLPLEEGGLVDIPTLEERKAEREAYEIKVEEELQERQQKRAELEAAQKAEEELLAQSAAALPEGEEIVEATPL